MNIKEFVKNKKIAVIAGSVVLAAAIISGITFGVVNHKNKVESKTFSPSGSSVSAGEEKGTDKTGDNSSKENTAGETSASSDSSVESATSSTIETLPTPNNNSSATSNTTSKKPTTSTNKPSGSTSTTQPATSTPSTSTPTTPTTPTTNKWTCPDPNAHPEKSASACLDKFDHNDFVAQHQAKLEEEANPNKRNPEDIGTKCYICGRVYGDDIMELVTPILMPKRVVMFVSMIINFRG